jgi:hypothetical protein
MADQPTDKPRPRRWTYVALGVGISLLVLIAFLGVRDLWPPVACLSVDCYEIEATKVTRVVDAGGVYKWAGTFTVSKWMFGIPSDLGAGACLMVDYGKFRLPPITGPNGRCTDSTHCHGPILKTVDLENDPYFVDLAKNDSSLQGLAQEYQGWESACDQKTQTCWVRPQKGQPYHSPICNIHEQRAEDLKYDFFGGEQPAPALPVEPFDLEALMDTRVWKYHPDPNKSVNVRLGACLNGPSPAWTPTSPQFKACGMRVFGEPNYIQAK